MTDQMRQSQQVEVSCDAMYQQMALVAATGCSWAHAEVDPGTLDLLLWPRDRGDYPHGVPYRIDQRVVERGLWHITLRRAGDLPRGVTQAGQDEALKAQIARSAWNTPAWAVDQVVQCGLFGEVLYR